LGSNIDVLEQKCGEQIQIRRGEELINTAYCDWLAFNTFVCPCDYFYPQPTSCISNPSYRLTHIPSDIIVKLFGAKPVDTTIYELIDPEKGIFTDNFDIAPNKEMALYPNPVIDTYLNIQMSNEQISSIELFSSTGLQIDFKDLIKVNDRQHVKLNVIALQAGLYFVRVRLVNGEHIEKRFVKL
jgi:hypothetical protein